MPSSPRHPHARNRNRQSAARRLAHEQGLTYQQALQRLARPWYSAVVHLSISALTDTPAQALTRALDALPARLPELGDTVLVCALDAGRMFGAVSGVVVVSVQADTVAHADTRIDRVCEALRHLPGVDDADRSDWEPTLTGREPNLRLAYRYRDEHNYHTHHHLIPRGVAKLGQLQRLREDLDEGVFFIPGQVGLPDLQPTLQRHDTTPGDVDADHPWHELDGVLGGDSLTVTDQPADELTVAELLDAFTAATWDEHWPVRSTPPAAI